MCSSTPHAVITGGHGGLAQAIATDLEARGYIVDAPGRDELDVTSAEAARAYLRERPGMTLLIHCAGITRDQTILRMAEADWDAVVSTNLSGAARCSREAIRQMLAHRTPGHIVHVGSFAAVAGTPGQAAYAAAKAGLLGLTRSLAREVGSRGIRVNCVLPGFLETRMTEDLPEAVLDRVLAEHCLGRFTTPEDTARFITNLDTLAGISGQVFNLDSRIPPWL